jgi:aspartyl-tRNA(Asn)/glutamyl-tRNA(Gln) amidotransferase subunit A
VSLAGGYPRAYSLDCAGPLARNVSDLAILLQAMAGYDPAYKHSIRAPEEDFSRDLMAGIRGVKIGVIDDFSYRDVDRDVERAVETATNTLANLGARVIPVRIPMLAGSLEYASLLNILLYEFHQTLGKEYRRTSNKDLFGPIVHANIAKGEAVSTESYQRLLHERAQQKAAFREVFKHVQVLVTPTMPTVAPMIATSGDNYDRGRQFALPFSWVGVPSISVPCGFDPSGLPIGMQLIVDEMQEALLFRVGAAYESATPFHRQRPPVYTTATVQ